MHFWPSRQKFFNRSPKSNDEYMNFFQQYFSRKVFFRKNWQSCCKFSTRSSKNIYEPIVLFSNKSFLQKNSSGTEHCNFDNLAANFSPEARREITNLSISFKQYFSIQMLPWKCKIKFWQPCQKNSTQKLNKIVNFYAF